MTYVTILEELEAERARLAALVEEHDVAIAALRPLVSQGNGRPERRPVKKAPPVRAGRKSPKGKRTAKQAPKKAAARGPAWDAVQGERLWKTRLELTIAQIAEKVGTTEANFGMYARKHWGPRPKAKAQGSAARRACKGCGSTIGPDRDSCPACGMPAP